MGEPQAEYSDVSENLRHYANMRFAQLTVFAAVNGGLIAWFADTSSSNPSVMEKTVTIVIASIGMLAAIVFFVLEIRSAAYWTQFKERAVELEKQLGYLQYTRAPKRSGITATNATRFFHVMVILLWLAAIIYAACRT